MIVMNKAIFETQLKLYTYVDGGDNDTPFPLSSENPIEIGAFRYDAKRMGGAPTITASVNYPSCLDDEWTDNVYAEFNGEKYFLKQTPTSSYNNESTMYRYDLELVSERVALDNVYFFDVVTDDIVESDKPVSNSSRVVFFGGIREFRDRLNASLEYSGLDYRVEVDEDVTSEEKLLSFEDQFISNVLQEIYNTYEVPYYFNGKEIRIGYSKVLNEGEELPTFSYGIDNALLSITKNNANYKIVNRATGTGSSDNIPFYYPNNSPKGNLTIGGNSSATYAIVDGSKFSSEMEVGDVVTFASANVRPLRIHIDGQEYYGGEINVSLADTKPMEKGASFTFEVDGNSEVIISGNMYLNNGEVLHATNFMKEISLLNQNGEKKIEVKDGQVLCGVLGDGTWTLSFVLSFPYLGRSKYKAELSLDIESRSAWYNVTQDKETSLKKLGLAIVDGEPSDGDTIEQGLERGLPIARTLMPYKYRFTEGKDRFYNAINGRYENPNATNEEDRYIKFNNPFVEGKPKEHIIKVEDIKPSIEGMMVNGERIDMFEEIRFDKDDNDETYEDEEGNVFFKHPYFFAKLKPLGFNLFDHAIEQQPMVISFTKGDCGACSFEIAVDEETQENTVQVDENGDLVYDDNGRVLCGAEGSGQGDVQPQPEQQDTTHNSVWIALRKEEDTYGILMPQYGKHEPSTNDTFVILGINLPYEYIENAEKRLEAEIIKYLQDNNDEKFTFSISFSRIYFAEEENKGVLERLNENSKITIIYNEKPYELFVSSFSYTMSEGDVLPEIRVELDETLKTSQNALQNAISEVKGGLGNAINTVAQEVAIVRKSFVSKVEDDTALGTVDFSKGIKFGEGGKVEILDNNSAKLTIEYLEVTKKASFTSLEIQEKTHVGGQILVTPASLNCGEVEELDDVYRCYFQTKNADGDEIFNLFAVDDQAICQTYNSWGSRYYWRLVVGVGEDYIDLSKDFCDEGSGVPMAGDKIVQLGNQSDVARQNAIVIAAYGDGSPYIIQYKGINKFKIEDKHIVTKLSSTENIFTGKVHMQMGSDGDLEVGGRNMLRNSGFTGDYLSAQIADKTVLDSLDKMHNPPLVHWDDATHPAVGATVQDSKVSASGKEVYIKNGSITQKLYQSVVAGETYMVTFKAKGALLKEELDKETGETIKTYSTVSVSFGGMSFTEKLEDKWKDVSKRVTVEATGDLFVISTEDATLCELQLERGVVSTGWSNSPFDNSSDRAYYEASKYVSNALESAAKATQGSTTVLGGLILTQQIRVGDTSNNTPFVEYGGVSGEYVNGDSPAFWAGGDLDKADKTAAKYRSTTTTPEGEIPYVVTHGGKVVLNDAFVRGRISSKEGNIGAIEITEEGLKVDIPSVNGEMTITDGGINMIGDTSVLLGSRGGCPITAVGKDAMLQVPGDDKKVAIMSVASEDGYAFCSPSGMFAGLRPKTTVATSGVDASDAWRLGSIDHSVLVNSSSGTCYISIIENLDGQEYEIYSLGAALDISTNAPCVSMQTGEQKYGYETGEGRRKVIMKYFAEAYLWVAVEDFVFE